MSESLRNRSLQMMRDPYSWPMLTLPVKRHVRGPAGSTSVECGVMFDERPRVYTVNQYQMSEYKGQPIDDIPHKDYLDLEGLLDDGWEVD